MNGAVVNRIGLPLPDGMLRRAVESLPPRERITHHNQLLIFRIRSVRCRIQKSG